MLFSLKIDLNSVKVSQNFAILLAFGVAFFIGLLLFTEFNTSTVHETAVVLFKHRFRSAAMKTPGSSSDEEALGVEERSMIQEIDAEPKDPKEKVATYPAVTDVFSWQHINYTVPISSNEERKLLVDVSGYVAPGKLTALMGESGAGKTTLLNVLAQRISIGIVSGDIFVNGQALTQGFQSQTYVPTSLDEKYLVTVIDETGGIASSWTPIYRLPLFKKLCFSLPSYVNPLRSRCRRKRLSASLSLFLLIRQILISLS